MKTLQWFILSLVLSPVSCQSKVEPKTAADPTLFSQGQVTIRGTFSCDLDAGRETNSGSDFFWEQATAVERYIAPTGGAAFAVTNRSSLADMTYSAVTNLTYSTDKINASNSRANRIPTGTIVAYKTNDGRYGAFQVTTYAYDLTIRWQTYNKL